MDTTKGIAKHTPGPWKYTLLKRTGFYQVTKQLNDNDALCCDILIHEGKEEEAEANAKLIAAAPELLDALLAANEYIKRISDPIGYQQFGTEAIQKATS